MKLRGMSRTRKKRNHYDVYCANRLRCPPLKVGTKVLSARLAKVLNLLIISLTTCLCNARDQVTNSGEIRQRTTKR